MEFLRKLLEQVKNLWGRWGLVQKLVLAGIGLVLIIGIVALVSVSSSPSLVPVIDAPIADEDARDRIITRINQEGYKVTVGANGTIMVSDAAAARKIRGILIREDLIPTGIDPWAIFDRERWTLTDFDRNVNFLRSQTQMVREHIKALDGVDDANVSIVMPKDTLFLMDQNPATASVIITPTPGSDIGENRKKIEGIQKLLKYAIEGLKDENIVITDQTGVVLNDFAGMADWDEQSLIERQQKYILTMETKYRALILSSLQSTFSLDRVRDVNIKFDMDMSKKSINRTEYLPTTLKARTPGLAYDDSQIVDSIKLSESRYKTTFEGTGFNPEGPTGMEPNVMPSMKDMSNIQGKVTQDVDQVNNLVSNEVTEEERKPEIDRVTVSVNIDGNWKPKYDEKGRPVILPNNSIEREYTPVDPAILKDAQLLVQDAIGYTAVRGDSVTVRNIPFDRTKQFAEEDAAYFRQQNIQKTIFVFLVGLAVLLIAFVAFRLVTKAIERKRLADEEAMARERQAARERALLEAEQEGVEVSMSVEERKRMELQENVISMAKDHPEDAAQLIRTWLLED
ncbi:MAG: flagellar M-ring protein FliF [Spirochaetaceae bacterium]|jgi:flagellar M-ring protein FliF|nr:flagellar M-ring protein FliF [Spirochaetaceae bacterium]